VTPLGRLFACIVMILGILSFALPLAVVGNNFQTLYNDRNERKKTKQQLRRCIVGSQELFSQKLEELLSLNTQVSILVKEIKHLLEQSGINVSDLDVNPHVETINIHFKTLKERFSELGAGKI